MTSIQTKQLSPYVAILEQEINEDLRNSVKPEDLRAEVRKALFLEVLRQASAPIGEMQGNLSYGASEDAIRKCEAKLARHLGYVQELLGLRAAQRIDPDRQIAAPTEETEDLEVIREPEPYDGEGDGHKP